MTFEVLEPCVGKLTCTVPRRVAVGNDRRLSDSEPYSHSTDITDLMDAPEALIEAMWGKPFHLIDLTQALDEDLLSQGDMGVLQYALKHIWATRYDEHLREILRGLVVSDTSQEGAIRLLRILLQYTESRANISKEGFIECLKEATVDDNVRNEVMTVLEQMKQEGLEEGILLGEKKAMAALNQVKEEGILLGKTEGKAEGKAEGIAEGQRKVALQMLRAGLSIGQVIQWTGLVEGLVQELAEEAGAPIN